MGVIARPLFGAARFDRGMGFPTHPAFHTPTEHRTPEEIAMNRLVYRAPRFRTTLFQARITAAPQRFRVVRFRVRRAPAR